MDEAGEKRLASLETEVRELRATIEALKTSITALQEKKQFTQQLFAGDDDEEEETTTTAAKQPAVIKVNTVAAETKKRKDDELEEGEEGETQEVKALTGDASASGEAAAKKPWVRGQEGY